MRPNMVCRGLVPAVLLSLSLASCDYVEVNTNVIEHEIQKRVLNDITGIASLEAVYLVTYLHYQENTFESDDFFIQNDVVNVDYGFKVDDKNIQVVNEGGKRLLRVRLPAGEALAINRYSESLPEVVHAGFRPKDKKDNFIDIDKIMNKEVDKVRARYEGTHLKYAEQNIESFFRVLAAKYDLELDLQVEERKPYETRQESAAGDAPQPSGTAASQVAGEN